MVDVEDNRVFVARRPLKFLHSTVNSAGPFYIDYKPATINLYGGSMAHSALLVRLEHKYYLIEYMDDSNAHVYSVPNTSVK